MKETTLRSEQDALLLRMATEPKPPERWPAGCYGSRLAWLVFVGPSPGGRDGTVPEGSREEQSEPLWNTDYTEPYECWSRGFKVSTRILVETITGRTQGQGAMKLYSFANFDWKRNPRSVDVPETRMNRGAPVVLQHLECVKPRVIVTMERKTHKLLTQKVEARYQLRRPRFGTVRIFWTRTRLGPRYHRSIDAYELVGEGPLSGAFVVRSPQHPARFLDAMYASRVANALREVVVCLAEGRERIELVYDA